ncbi:hypothetical protein GCM10007415_22640 [Parapedobacter pyrenivorans]|uniref:Glycosyl hydrolase-like 10 domain-containing protein n=1 Tax=Parapedobacter pyrenivorans TaxID=1305674 RepID=A0A917MAM9_9SPHI|nr:hypothetical protein [Parapedobacter pyrenivorans]GGG88148.1 hypothetical protein GCM10007415_22640 [Parapedobacter pyrenivorans]
MRKNEMSKVSLRGDYCRNRYAYAFTLLSVLTVSFQALAQKKADQPKVKDKIIVNVAADAIVAWPSWRKDIDSLDRDEIVYTLRNYIDEYAKTQVTTILYNVNYQRAAYDSKVMTPYWDLPAGVTATSWALPHAKLRKKQVDPFEVCIKRTREQNMSPWLSIRMNDHHYWDDSTKLSSFILEHPEYMLYPTAFMNYGKKEVRDFYLALISEALDKYDVDGIELDWIRTQTLFKDGTQQDWIAIVNDFMRQARELVNQKAAKRGHPIRIATRVLSTPEISESYGLDGVAWVKNGWTDMLIPANWHNPTNFDIPLELWRKLIGPNHDYVLAPSADMYYSCQRDPYGKTFRFDLESMRGFALSAFNRGADAIYLFNHFNRRDYDRKVIESDGSTYKINDRTAILTEIGSAETVNSTPRRHPLTYPSPAGRNKETASLLPVDLTAAEQSFTLYTGPKTANADYVVLAGLELMEGYETAKIQVKVNDVLTTVLPDVTRANGTVYTKTKKWEQVGNVADVAPRVMRFKIDPKAVKAGYNTISLVNPNGDQQKLIWLEVKVEAQQESRSVATPK